MGGGGRGEGRRGGEEEEGGGGREEEGRERELSLEFSAWWFITQRRNMVLVNTYPFSLHLSLLLFLQ